MHLQAVSIMLTASSVSIVELYIPWGFYREEEIHCLLKKALSYDANCQYHGPLSSYNNAADYNNPKGLDYAAGFQEAQKALEIAQSRTHL